MVRTWVTTYGVTQGTSAKDWVSAQLSARDLSVYQAPLDPELGQHRIKALFLGHYFPWDPENSYRVAAKHGFNSEDSGPRTGIYNHTDIDDHFISIHHYLKWYKFGFTRAFDNLSLEIRHGRITRSKAIESIAGLGDPTPLADIRLLCEFLDITTEHFFEVIERFRNPDIWNRDPVWHIPDFLVHNWKWQ